MAPVAGSNGNMLADGGWRVVPPWQQAGDTRPGNCPPAQAIGFSQVGTDLSKLLDERDRTTAETHQLRTDLEAKVAPNLSGLGATPAWDARSAQPPPQELWPLFTLLTAPILSTEMVDVYKHLHNAATEVGSAATIAGTSIGAAVDYGTTLGTAGTATAFDAAAGYGSTFGADGYGAAREYGTAAAGATDHLGTAANTATHAATGVAFDAGAAFSGALAATAYRAFVDWDDLKSGEIDAVGWMRDRFLQASGSMAGGIVGGLLAAPFGPYAIVAGSVAGKAAVGWMFRAWRQSAEKRDFDAYLTEVTAVDEEHDREVRSYDAAIERLRRTYRQAYEALLAQAPSEEDFAAIQWAADALLGTTVNLSSWLTRRPSPVPGQTWRQRRDWRRELRVEQESWFNELDRVRTEAGQGRYLDALSLAVTINRGLVHRHGVLVVADWAAIHRRLSSIPQDWSGLRTRWSRKVRQGARPHEAAYRAKGTVLRASFNDVVKTLAERRKRALLTLVNQDRKRRRNPRLLTSITELDQYLQEGKLRFEVR